MASNINNDILISVLLPVYNSERFLKEAIDSILNQTYSKFELLIINDGSTDNCLSILNSYNDKRIVLINNETNKGLIYTLNKGIDLAKGKYIARMDGDDISLPNRLEIQLSYFINEPNVAVVCSPIIAITESGNTTKSWQADIETKTEQQIKNTLPKENCIAHPSVMIDAAMAKKYKYSLNQKGSEDWDLWLRLLADNKRIIKTTEPLLKYRFVNAGITRSYTKKQSTEVKVLLVRFKFIIQQLVCFNITSTLFKAMFAQIRTMARIIKLHYSIPFLRSGKRLITINPFKVIKQFNDLKKHSKQNKPIDIFFFFPYCHIGGAEKVHANIVEVFKDKNCLVLFTGISDKEDFLYLFKQNASSLNIGYCANYPLFAKQTKEIILNLIHQQPKPIVFGCNNLFFYDNMLTLQKNVKVFDLMHDFRFENEDNLTHQFIEQFYRCEQRIFISQKAIEQTKLFYDFKGAPKREYDKLKLITNYVDIPNQKIIKNFSSNLEVLYIGRGTEEKRANLVGEIAKNCHQKNEAINFTAIGDLEKVITPDCKPHIILTGAIYDFEKIKPYYQKAHIILITSYREGFPLVIMEGMAYGLVPISTPVGDVPLHINTKNGFMTSTINENEVVNEISDFILKLQSDRTLLEIKSNQAFDYANIHFSKQTFENEYRKTLGI